MLLKYLMTEMLQPMEFQKSTLVASGADAQLTLRSSCVSAPLATNVDLFACFAERLFNHYQLIMEYA